MRQVPSPQRGMPDSSETAEEFIEMVFGLGYTDIHVESSVTNTRKKNHILDLSLCNMKLLEKCSLTLCSSPHHFFDVFFTNRCLFV